MSDIASSAVTILLAIIGVALIAVLVSKNANTGDVLTSGGSALSGLLSTAISPLTGSGFTGSIPSLTSSAG
jgi:PRD1 phage membrane DNA delivery